MNSKIFYLLSIVVLVMFSHFLGKYLLVWNKTSFGLFGIILGLLVYAVIVFAIGSEKMEHYLLLFIIASITFPYLIQFVGKDALTLTTVSIFFIFASMIINSLVRRSSLDIINLDFAVPVILFVSLTISLITNYDPEVFGQAFRHYVYNTSGIVLYFVILLKVKNKADIVKMIKILLVTLVLQSVISFIQIRFPPVYEVILNVFGARGYDPSSHITLGFVRATGTVWDYELLANLFLIGSILSIFLIYEKKKYNNTLFLFACLAGLIFTKTRSSILLFGLAIVLMIMMLNFFRKDYKATSVKIGIIIVLASLVSTALFADQVELVVERLMVYFESEDHFTPEALNRAGSWKKAINFILEDPRMFGNGLYNISTARGYVIQFHSLYLTLLFKIGYIGLAVYLAFWLRLVLVAFNALINGVRSDVWYCTFFLFLSTIMILCDSIKIEYIRHGHFIQFVFVIYALLTVSSRLVMEDVRKAPYRKGMPLYVDDHVSITS